MGQLFSVSSAMIPSFASDVLRPINPRAEVCVFILIQIDAAGCQWYNGVSKFSGGANCMRRSLSYVIILVLLVAFCANACASSAFDLNAGNIRADTEYLCNEIGIRVTGTPEEIRTADWIENRLSAMGFGPESEAYFRTGFVGAKGKTSENLGIILNEDPSLPLAIIVAHYDTVPTSPGARDNSASVAILLEMARWFSENGAIPGCEVRLVFLGSEENGYHGARAYANTMSESDRKRHIGTFNMDISCASPSDNAQLVMNILGGKNSDGVCVDIDYLPSIENTVTGYVARAHAELYGGEPVPVFYYGESDHLPFHEAGMEAANIGWRRVGDLRPILPDSYHTMEDTPDALDYNTAVITGRCILRAIEMFVSGTQN